MSDTFWQLLLNVAQGVLPPLIVTWVTGLAKKWKESLTPLQITGLVVPFLAAGVAAVDYFLFDANVVWTFVLGLASVAFYELKKNFTE